MPDEWKDLVRHIDYKDSPSSMKLTVDITLEDINKYLEKWTKEGISYPEKFNKELWEQYLKENKLNEEMMEMFCEQVVEDVIPWARKNHPKEVPEKKPSPKTTMGKLEWKTYAERYNKSPGARTTGPLPTRHPPGQAGW